MTCNECKSLYSEAIITLSACLLRLEFGDAVAVDYLLSAAFLNFVGFLRPSLLSRGGAFA